MKNLQRVVSLILIVTLFSESVFAATFVVDRNDNIVGANGCIDATDNDCSLYGAISSANNTVGTHTIVFDNGNISPDLTAVTTVTIDISSLPAITRSGVTINGDFYSANNTPDVTINGNGNGGSSDALFGVTASGVTIKGLNIYNWGGTGISVEAGTATVSYNRIGINGTDDMGATRLTTGVDIAADNATVTGNVISGIRAVDNLTGNGVAVGTMPGPIGGLSVTNNKIGTNSAGTAAVANEGSGVNIMGNTNGINVISGNVLSGNSVAGVKFGSSGNLGGTYWIHGNEIGTNAVGDAAIANGTGISAATNASSVLNLTIGGDVWSERNVISGNTGDGISIESADTAVISGNYIGTAADGTTDLGNGADGVQVNATTLVQIGTDNDGINDGAEWNTISGNGANGIHVLGAGLATIRVIGNFLGLNKNGAVGLSMGNALAGILINASAATVITLGAPKVGTDSVENYIGNNGSGIDIQNTGGGAGITIQNNILGLDLSEMNAPNNYAGGTGIGVKVNLSSGTSTVAIGADSTPLTTERNVISNGITGIYLGNGVVTGTIKRNFIGLKQSLGEYIGDAGNGGGVLGSGGGVGIYVNSTDANLNTLNIGGSNFDEYNFIGFNDSYAVHVKDAGTNPANVNVIGNIMGWGQDGTTEAANSNGILIEDGNAVVVSANNIGNTYGGSPLEVTGGVTLTVTGNMLGQSDDGSVAGPNAGTAAILVNAATLTSVVIGGITAALGNVIAASAGGGIQIQNVAANTTPISILGNYIGVCADLGTGVINVDILADCDNATIGIYGLKGAFTIGGENNLGDAGTGTIAQANVISNNGSTGIYLTSNVATASILSNIVGLVRNGAAGVFNVAAPNVGTGIGVGTDLMTELILGIVSAPIASAGRLIVSSNGDLGISIESSGNYTGLTTTMKNVFIGTDWLGTTARPNAAALGGGFAYTTGGTLNIGGTAADEGNVISGNTAKGIYLGTPYVLTANILGNVIGLAYGGAADLGNGSDGVFVDESSVNLDLNIGNGTVAGRNVIAGNGGYGVNAGSGDVTIKGNYFGVAADGTTSITNTTNEIYAVNTAGSISNLTVGGSVAGEKNTINNATMGFITNVAASNESTLDGDNTWTETTINSLTAPTNRFWQRVVNSVVLAWGPYECNDGLDNDGDGNIDNGVDAGCSTIYDNTENSDVVEEEPAPAGGGYVASGSSNSSSTATTTTTTTTTTEPTTTTTTEPSTTEPVVEPTVDTTVEPVVPTEPTPIQKAIAEQLVLESINSLTDEFLNERVDTELLFAAIVEPVDSLPEAPKSAEVQQIESVLEKISSGEVLTEAETQEFENVASAVVQEQISESLNAAILSGSSSSVTVSSGGVSREVTKNTDVVFIADTQLANAMQKVADERGVDKYVATFSTILNTNNDSYDGVSLFLLATEGGDIDDEDAAKKVFYAGDVSGVRAKTLDQLRPDVPTVTNLNGREVGETAVLWMLGSPGEKVSLFAVQKPDMEDPESWQTVEFGDYIVETDGTAVATVNFKESFGNEAKDLELIIQNEKGEGSKSLVHYNPEFSENLEELKLTDEKLASVDETRQVNGYAEPGTVIMITWKSLTYNSVVVADASQGYFEVDIPEELEAGDHTVLAYSVKSKKLSNYTQLFFNKVF